MSRLSSPGPSGVFLDPTGRRWRVLCTGAVLTLTMLVAAGLWILPHLLQPAEAQHAATAVTLPGTGPAPATVGDGPLERVLEVQRTPTGVRGLDPFTHRPVTLFGRREAAELGAARFVVQRFGYSHAATHTICLTFDDGPDPVYTPKLLDVLSRWKVPATFFLIGEHAAAAPQIVQRMIREGHAVGNHSLTHPDLTDQTAWRVRAELVLTDRTLRAITGQRSGYVRIPYGGFGDGDSTASIDTILRLQQWGYLSASYDYDSLDWEYESGALHRAIPLPPLDGRNLTVLLHDGGGDGRQRTIDYVDKKLIPAAKAAGYTFLTMPQAQPALAGLTGPITPTTWDRAARMLVTAVFVWPSDLRRDLFALAVLATFGVGACTVVLALVRRARRPRYPTDLPWLKVTVVIAAFNEEKVIAQTLRTLAAQTYPLLDVVVVDDGSTDGTSAAVLSVAARDPTVRLVRQANSGKWAALNRGIAAASGEIIVTLDADTSLIPTTVANLVRHFALDSGGRLGAVGGVVRVGNRSRNLLTRWQALEYVTQIGVERAAYAQLGAIPVVPGACAAWRKDAVLQVGGHSGVTLAEDCDLTLALHAAGWRVGQDDEALAFTEAPDHVDALLAQRVRWTYGTLQSLAKHRDLFLRRRYGWLGMVVLPYTALSVLVPLLFTPLVTVMAVQTVRIQGWSVLLVYFGIFAAVHFAVAGCALWLMGETPRHLLMVPLYRLIYEPLRIYLLYTSAYLALRGIRTGWNKQRRTGDLDHIAGLAGAAARIPAAVQVVSAAIPAPIHTAIPATMSVVAPAAIPAAAPAVAGMTEASGAIG